MDLNSVCSSSFLGFVLRRAFLFLSVSSDLRTNAGIGRKVPFNFYNSKNISREGHASGRSLIDKLRFIVASNVILRSFFLYYGDLLFRQPVKLVDQGVYLSDQVVLMVYAYSKKIINSLDIRPKIINQFIFPASYLLNQHIHFSDFLILQ